MIWRSDDFVEIDDKYLLEWLELRLAKYLSLASLIKDLESFLKVCLFSCHINPCKV